jgi:primase-polymerase (primpol)-like protein
MSNESRHPGEGAAAGNVNGNDVPSQSINKTQAIGRFGNIPAELKAYPQWVTWKFVYTIGTKPKKVPLNPSTGSFANHSDPATWGSFDQACAAFRDQECDGIGFVLSDADPFTFIDLDDCEGDAEAIAVRDKIMAGFDSYTERSPSSRGFHIIVRGRVAAGRRRGKVEVYSSQRFMTMTGDVL